MLAGGLMQGAPYNQVCSDIPGRFLRARMLVDGADSVATLWLLGVARDR